MARPYVKRWTARKGTTFNVSHSFAPYVAEHSTTLTTAATEEVDSGIAIQDEAVASNLWSGQVVCSQVGNFTYVLKGTFADGSIDPLEFLVSVYDRNPRQSSGTDYGW